MNRIAALDDGGIVTLTAGNVYTFVVHRHCGDLAAGNTWEFRMTYLSAAAPAAPAAPAAAPDASWDPGDARLNRQPAQPTAVYCEAQGLFAYGPQGQPMLYASWEAIEAAGVPTNAPLPLDMNEAMHAGFFRLPDGWFQIVVNGGPEEYIYRWDGCPMTHTITEVFSTATGERLVYEAQ